MKYSKFIFPIFLVMVLVQLFVPAKMIWNHEKTLVTGKVYKFKTRPIDPADPFRGKYIVLRFYESEYPVSNPDDWEKGQSIFVLLSEDADGYAKIAGITPEKPAANQDFVKAKIRYIKDYASNAVVIGYPFDRYYMEESKAKDAEKLTRRQPPRRNKQGEILDNQQEVYAVVRILDGEAVLENVMIDGEKIEDVVKRMAKE